MPDAPWQSVAYRPGEITAADYDDAINDLLAAKAQSWPSFRSSCSVCTGEDHRAETCQQNLLVLARQQVQAKGSRPCYHCSDVS